MRLLLNQSVCVAQFISVDTWFGLESRFLTQIVRGGETGHATQNFVKSVRAGTMITVLQSNNIPVWYCLSHDKYLKFQLKEREGIIIAYLAKNNFKEYFTPIRLGLRAKLNRSVRSGYSDLTFVSLYFSILYCGRMNVNVIIPFYLMHWWDQQYDMNMPFSL